MSLVNTQPTLAQDLCASAAITGLFGTTTEVLRRLPKDQALALIDQVGAGLAHFAWQVDAQGDRATIKCSFLPTTGPSIVLAVQTVDLTFGGAPDHAELH